MQDEASTTLPKRLYSLDVLRGFAALSIVIFHWPNMFFQAKASDPDILVSEMPLYSLLFLFYQSGSHAVDLFFVLSGFVFYWLYSVSVQSREIGVRDFWVLRFSRLYPLHLATLLLVLLLQSIYRAQVGTAFVYPHNDTYHFFLQLLFASEWGLQEGHSFNGPIWSVSVEILLYGIFFLVCFARKSGFRTAALMCCLGLAVYKLNGAVGRGVFAFFVGGLTYFLASFLMGKTNMARTTRVCFGLCLLAWTVVVAGVRFSTFERVGTWLVQRHLPVSEQLVTMVWRHLCEKLVVAGLFPLTILSLVFFESRHPNVGWARLSFLGDISYASYLLHFPLQLLIATVFVMLGWRDEVFLYPWALGAFYALLIPLCIFTHRHFERPIQAKLRAKFLPKVGNKTGMR